MAAHLAIAGIPLGVGDLGGAERQRGVAGQRHHGRAIDAGEELAGVELAGLFGSSSACCSLMPASAAGFGAAGSEEDEIALQRVVDLARIGHVGARVHRRDELGQHGEHRVVGVAGKARGAGDAGADELGDLGAEDQAVAIGVGGAVERIDDGGRERVVDIGHGLAGIAGGEHEAGIVGEEIERPGGGLLAQGEHRLAGEDGVAGAGRLGQHGAREAGVEEQEDVLGGDRGERGAELVHRIAVGTVPSAGAPASEAMRKPSASGCDGSEIAVRRDIDDEAVLGLLAVGLEEVLDRRS